MRLWTIHPKYLDAQGLVTLWREALLARAVLRNRTRGYRHHPQLQRFKDCGAQCSAINAYLRAVLLEAAARGYSFDASKIGPVRREVKLVCTAGQVSYEWQHLLGKLKARRPELHDALRHIPRPETHPLFTVGPGGVESWERIGKRGDSLSSAKMRIKQTRGLSARTSEHTSNRRWST